jgi:2-polyprenyl-6-hydroxyphenyl methylase/3-demethylubiquinone-9 3-methyltransferase
VRPGGIVATATWTVDSPISEMFRTMMSFMPGPPPEGVSPPPLWGDEQHVREMFEPHGLELEFDRDVNVFEFDGTEEEFFEWAQERLPPLAMARTALAERWDEVRPQIEEVFSKQNQGENPPVRVPAEYVITIGRKPR